MINFAKKIFLLKSFEVYLTARYLIFEYLNTNILIEKIYYASAMFLSKLELFFISVVMLFDFIYLFLISFH